MNETLSVFRYENKYIIDKVTSNLIRKKLSKIIKEDNHSCINGYMVRSLYFDSLNNIDFLTKLAGTEVRKKIRIRVYDAKDMKCKLEMKEKIGDSQHKISISITKEDAMKLTKGDFSVLTKYFEKNKEAVRIYTIMSMGCYRPVAMIEYDRIAYVNPVYNTRITFDMNIRATESNFNLFDEKVNYNVVMNNETILEVKYNEKMLEYISNILKPYNLNKISVSKYCLSRKIFIDFNF